MEMKMKKPENKTKQTLFLQAASQRSLKQERGVKRNGTRNAKILP